MSDISKSLELVFKLVNGKTHTLTLLDPLEGLTKEDLENVIDNVIKHKFFQKNGSLVEGFEKAYIKSIEKKTL